MATVELTNTPSSSITDGTAITQANIATTTGGVGNDAYDTATYGTGASASVTTLSGWKVITFATTSGNSTLGWAGSIAASHADYSDSFEFIAPAAAPTGVCTIAKGYSDATYTTAAWALAITTGMALQMYTGTASAGVVTGSTLTPNAKYTVKLEVVAGTSASVLILSSTGTTVASQSFSSANFGATRSARVGLGTGSVLSSFSIRTRKSGSGPGFLDQATQISVSAGADQSTYTGSAATLAATIAPGTGSGTQTVAWTKVSGPSGGSFSASSSLNTNFTATTAGTYVLAVAVTDDSGTSSDNLTLTVADAPSTVVPATVNASTGFTANAGTVLTAISDGSDATYVRSSDNPSSLVLDWTFQSLSQPAAGQPFVVRVKCRRNTATSGTMVGKLYEGATLRSTIAAVTIPNSAAYVDLTFPAADLTAIAAGSWTSGIRVTGTVNAAP